MKSRNFLLLKIQTFLLCAIAALLLLKASYAIIILITLGIIIVFSSPSELFSRLIKSPIALLFIGYYIWHAAGILWSDNKEYAYKDLEMKLSFLAFPLLFSGFEITSYVKKKVLLSYIIGCFTTCFYLLAMSFIEYKNTNDIHQFFYTDLSRFIHPTYLSMYLNVALLVLISHLKPPPDKKVKYIIIPAILFMIAFIMMLSSRMAILTCIATCSIYILILPANENLKNRILYLTGFIFLSATAFYASNHFFNRIEQVEVAMSHIEEKKPETDSEYNSASSRPELWKEAVEVILHHPLIGAGTGDIKDELISEYKIHHFQYAFDRKLNPHNQFLHTAVGLGLIGLLLLLLCFLSQCYLSYQQTDWLYFCFLIILILNGFTESNIEVQSGILLFNFFSMFFYSALKSENKPVVR